MTIQQLKCLWTVVTTNSFTESAEILHMSQSTLSKKISALEHELGLQLLNRHGKRFSVSSAGQMLMQHFAKLLEAYDQTMQIVDEIKSRETPQASELKLLVVPAVANYGMLPLLNQFMREHPEIHLSFDEMDEDRLLLLLQSGYSDLAFCSDISLDPAHYKTQPHCREDFIVMLSPNNPLARMDLLTFEDLEDQNLIFNRRESQLYDLCMRACHDAGVEPRVAFTTSNPNIAMEQILYNDNLTYVGLREALKRRMPSSRCKLIELDDSPFFHFVFAWRRDKPLPAAAQQFLEYMREQETKCSDAAHTAKQQG